MRLGTVLAWAGLAALVTLLAVLTAPRLFGGQSYAVITNSMAGSVDAGDLVIVLPHKAEAIEVGEIVAFTDPEGSGRTFQHRVQRVSRKAGQIEVVTMGDANTGYERWRVGAGESVGRVAFVIAKAGYVFGPISNRAVARLLGAAAWLALLGLCLQMVWRRPHADTGGLEAG